jgi:hypothetical protein
MQRHLILIGTCSFEIQSGEAEGCIRFFLHATTEAAGSVTAPVRPFPPLQCTSTRLPCRNRSHVGPTAISKNASPSMPSGMNSAKHAQITKAIPMRHGQSIAARVDRQACGKW